MLARFAKQPFYHTFSDTSLKSCFLSFPLKLESKIVQITTFNANHYGNLQTRFTRTPEPLRLSLWRQLAEMD